MKYKGQVQVKNEHPEKTNFLFLAFSTKPSFLCKFLVVIAT